MHFGRVENLDIVDFSLPEDDAITTSILSKMDTNRPLEIYIGCPVFADRGYVGKVFPKGTKNSDFLKAYCQQFNSIELNATHYNMPSMERIHKWKSAATEGFKFCPKFPQFISHRKDMHEREEMTNRFLESIYEFKEHLGMSFLQLPPYFKPEGLEKLYAFIENLPRDLQLAVELRQEDWFNNQTAKEELASMLHHFNTALVITDVAGRRDVLHQVITTDTAFIRFTGNNLHATDYTRIDDWVLRISSWIKQGLRKVYFFMHEPEKALCADLAIYMINQLNDLPEVNLRPPVLYDRSESLFDQ